jgi:di/tricarboxylate transporter
MWISNTAMMYPIALRSRPFARDTAGEYLADAGVAYAASITHGDDHRTRPISSSELTGT